MTCPASPGVQDEVRRILTDESPSSSAALVRQAEETARYLATDRAAGGETGKAQIRAIFDELRQIEAIWLTDARRAQHRLHLLKPKMAYRASRARGLAPLVEVLTSGVDAVTQSSDALQAKQRFGRLVEFCEAIIAYYTAMAQQGGRR